MEEIGKSSIVYNVSLEDLGKVQHVFSRTSKTIRQARLRRSIGIPVSIFLIVLGALVASSADVGTALYMALLGSLYVAGILYLSVKYQYPRRLKKMLRRLLDEDRNPGLIGERTLEVDEDGFTLTTGYSQTRCAWGQLVRIESEPDYTYMYTGAGNAVIIPHTSIEAGNLRALLAEVERHYHPEKLLVPARLL